MAKFTGLPKSKNVEDARVSDLYGTNKDIPRENPIDAIRNDMMAKYRKGVVEDIGNTWQAKTTPSQSNKEYKQDPEVIAQKIESGSIGDLIKRLGKKGK